MRVVEYETWEEYRRRILHETERFIEWGLKHPDEVIGIPTKRTGEGGFPAAVGVWFWNTVLTSRSDGRVQRWREILLDCTRRVLRRGR